MRKLAVRFLIILVRERPGDPSVPLARLAEMLGETYEPLTFDDDHFTAALSHTRTRKDLVTHSHEERERHMTFREFVAETLVALARERPDDLRAHEATFRPYLTHGDPHVREQTLRVYTAFGSLGSERAAAAPRDRRGDEPDPEVRASIDDALGARSAGVRTGRTVTVAPNGTRRSAPFGRGA